MGDIGDAGNYIGQPSLGIDVVELGGGGQAEHKCGPLPAAVKAGEQLYQLMPWTSKP